MAAKAEKRFFANQLSFASSAAYKPYVSGSRNRSKKQRADRRRERREKTVQIIRPEEQKTITGGGWDIPEPAAMNTAGNIPGMKKEGWCFFFRTRHEKEQVCTGCHRRCWICED